MNLEDARWLAARGSASQRAAESRAPSGRIPTEREFESAFDRLDRKGRNLVKIADLQRELGVDRDTLHFVVRRAQDSDRFGLDSSEGLAVQLTRDEIRAGLPEFARDTVKFLPYISRRD